MAGLFCSIDSEERKQLVNNLKEKFPNKSEQELITELNTASQVLNLGGNLPTMEDMDRYYELKNNSVLSLNTIISGARDAMHNKNAKQYYDYLKDLARRRVLLFKDMTLAQFNSKYGTNIQYRDDSNSDFRYEQKETLYGVDVNPGKDKKIYIERALDRTQLIQYLNEKFGLAIEILSDREYEDKVTSDKASNCGVIDDTMYIRFSRADRLSNEQFIEEFLHPTVHDVYKTNKELSEKLIKEARKDFPNLCEQIDVLYKKQGQDVINEEIITQVLSKYVNKEISDNGTNTRNLADYIRNFFAKIFESFNKLFGEIDTEQVKLHKRLNLRGRDIKDVLNYEEFAKILNSKNANFAFPLEAGQIRENRGGVDQSVLDEITAKTFTSTQQREDRVLLISRLISDTLTSMIDETGKTDVNRKGFLIQNIDNILNEVRSTFDDDVATEIYSNDDGKITKNYTESEFKDEFKKIRDSWQTLIEEASNILYITEGVSLSFYDGSVVSTQNNIGDMTGSDYDNRDNGEYGESSGKDGWMIKAREVDLRDTLSQQVRKVLNGIEKVNRDGQKEYDDLGFPRYLDQDYAHLKLLETISKINNSDEFDDALNGMVEKNPWVSQIIEELNSDSTLKAKFYQDLRKEFVPYWINVNGKTKQVNVKPTVFYFGEEWQYNQEQANILDKDSVYTSKGTIKQESGQIGLSIIDNIIEKLNDFSSEEIIDSRASDIRKMLGMVGIDFTEGDIRDALLTKNSDKNLDTILSSLNVIFNGVKNGLPEGAILYDEYKSQYIKIAEIFDDIPQGVTIASFREHGKNYQSYSNPSYIGRMINGFKLPNFKTYIENEFGKYKQFFKDGEYRIDWLRKLYSSKKYTDLIDRKVVLNYNDGVSTKEFNDWSEQDYLQIMIDEFFSDPSNSTGEKYAYYYLPLLSDAPSAEFIKFVRYTNTTERKPDGSYRTVEECIIPKLADVVKQEIDRINLIQARAKNPNIVKIVNFDKVGNRFLFFPELNTKTYDDGKSFIQKYIEQKNISNTDADSFIEEELSSIMNEQFDTFVSDKLINDIRLSGSEEVRNSKLKEFYYNNALAYTQIVELTTTDLAYYKSLNDFQKRYKEVYAMTSRLYTNSQYGKKVQRNIILKDFKIDSIVLKDVSEALDGAISDGRITKLDKDYILSQYKGMNIGDAQAYRSLASYRSILDMSGEWTDEMEQAYERITNNNWDKSDFDILWQNIKPFTFTQYSVDSEIEQYGDIKVPVQHKTAEFLLLSLYSQMAKNISSSPLLNSMAEFMDKNDIDLVLFESAVKVGAQGMVELPKSGTKEDYDNAFNSALKVKNAIHEISFEDFGIQVRNPEHLYDHIDIIGSQFRRLIDSDLPDNATFNVGGKNMNKNELHRFYQEMLTENILDSFQEVSDKFSNLESIEAAIQKEMAGNSRYSDEERKACTLVERNGVKSFQIPLFDPIQSTRIQQLLNSIIKKAVTKQSIRRASCVQVSSVGMTDELNVRYNDENGNLIFTEKEWNESSPSGLRKADYTRRKKLKNQFKTYKEYRDSIKSQSQAYWEVYLPAWSKQFFGILGEQEGNFEIEKIPDSLRMSIGLRIPTEAKYSMQPMYIKGFLPQTSGSTIMVPADIVTTTGSDFDFDKIYLYLKEFSIKNGLRRAYNELPQTEKDSWENTESENNLLQAILGDELSEQLLDDSEKTRGFAAWVNYIKENNKDWYDELVKDKRIVEKKYDYGKAVRENSRQARNNAIIDIATSVLTNKSLIEQVQKPGGFDEAIRVGSILDILRNSNPRSLNELLRTSSQKEAMDKLFALSKDEATSLSDRAKGVLNPLSPLTQTYFHSQNANGGQMIGIYAVGNASHASGEWSDTQLRNPIELFGKQYQKIDNMLNDSGKYISETLAQFLASSVDNVKQPVLKSLSQTTEVGDITNLLARLGVSIQDIGLIMSGPTYGYGKIADENLDRNKVAWAIMMSENDKLTSSENNELVSLLIDRKPENNDRINELTSKSDNITQEQRLKLNQIMLGIAKKMDELKTASESLRDITQAARGESLSNAAGPTIADNIVRLIKLQKLQKELSFRDTPITTNILDFDFLLDGNFNKDDMYVSSMNNKIPFLQAATKCGVVGTGELLNKLFPQTKPEVQDLLFNEKYGLIRYINIDYMSNDRFATIVNQFFNELYLYVLSSSNFFGGENASIKYNNTLNEFPKEFNKTKLQYPELNNNGLITKLAVVNQYGVQKIVFKNSNNLSKIQKQRLSNDWTQLLINNNDDIKNLGINLFRYAVLNGLTFDGPQSFIQLAPNVLRRAIPDYVNSLNMLMNYDGLNLRPFVDQFIRNRVSERGFSKSLRSGDYALNEDGTITVSSNKTILKVVEEPNDDPQKPNVARKKRFVNYPYIKVNLEDGNHYYRMISKDDNQKTVTYKQTTKLGIPHVFKEYYYGVEQPSTIVSQKTTNGYEQDQRYMDSLVDDWRERELDGAELEYIGDESIFDNVPEAKDPISGEPICK